MARTGRRGGGAARKETKREDSAGGVVIRDSDAGPRLLLIRDPYHNWGLPKGHIEPGESAEQAARREIAEETGLGDLDLISDIATIDWYFQERRQLIHKFCRFFLFRSATGEPRPELKEGISECAWVPYREALERITYDNAREVVREVGRRLRLELGADSRPPS